MTGAAASHLSRTLRTVGAVLEIGPFLVRLNSGLASVTAAIDLHYQRQLLPSDTAFCDFHIRLDRPRNHRAVWKPQARFYLDGASPFKPLPLSQAYPLFEWGLNWCIAQHAHHYLMVHAAVVERNGHALVMPGAPGSGKSTLAAALSLSGWRLLSDEFALISLCDGLLTPLPRPVSLKNQSIGLIRERYPAAVLGPETHDTSKGTVAHLRIPADSVERAGESAIPTWIVFPRFEASVETLLEPFPKAHALLELADCAFNYSVLGGQGFEAAADLIDKSECFDLSYGDLGNALDLLNALNTSPT